MFATLVAAVLVGASSVPAGALSKPALPVPITIIGSTCVVAAPSTVTLGRALNFENETTAKQTVTDSEGFWKFSVSAEGYLIKSMTHAGAYQLTCSGGAAYASMSVKLSAPSSASGSFKVTWANSSASSTYHYTVQYKIGSSGSIKTWKSSTSSRSATFNPKHFNTYYYFRAETIRTSSAKSGWSPWRKIHVT